MAPLSRDEALIRLLDDPSPAVRRALLAHFSAQPREALRLLSSLTQGIQSPLASIAQGYLDELQLKLNSIGDALFEAYFFLSFATFDEEVFVQQEEQQQQSVLRPLLRSSLRRSIDLG